MQLSETSFLPFFCEIVQLEFFVQTQLRYHLFTIFMELNTAREAPAVQILLKDHKKQSKRKLYKAPKYDQPQ
jgi:hypothetical protein